MSRGHDGIHMCLMFPYILVLHRESGKLVFTQDILLFIEKLLLLFYPTFLEIELNCLPFLGLSNHMNGNPQLITTHVCILRRALVLKQCKLSQCHTTGATLENGVTLPSFQYVHPVRCNVGIKHHKNTKDHGTYVISEPDLKELSEHHGSDD